MNKGSYIFNQLVSYLPARKFDRLVTKHKGNYKIRHFSCWNQLLCMILGHLKGCGSLGDIIKILNEEGINTYHLGLSSSISKANLAKANENRTFRIFSDFAFEFTAIVSQRTGHNFGFIKEENFELYSLIFQWNLLRHPEKKTENNNQILIENVIPAVFVISEKIHTEDFLLQQGGLYIFNSADPVNYPFLYRIHLSKSYFIIPFHVPEDFNRKSFFTENKEPAETDYFNHFLQYPETTRLIKSTEHNRMFCFLTNHPDLSIESITGIYKKRVEIESLSTYIRQSLKSKTFWGTSLNAANVQIFTGIVTSLLLQLVRSIFHIRGSTFDLRNHIKNSLLIRAPIEELLPMAEPPPGKKSGLPDENPRTPPVIPSRKK